MLDHDPKVIFVDNEGVFKEALRTSLYSDIFWDNFGGDFGHYTKRGEEILAGNIANAILVFLSTESSQPATKKL